MQYSYYGRQFSLCVRHKRFGGVGGLSIHKEPKTVINI